MPDDPTAGFAQLYAAAAAGDARIPWDRGGPRDLLVEWAAWRRLGEPAGRDPAHAGASARHDRVGDVAGAVIATGASTPHNRVGDAAGAVTATGASTPHDRVGDAAGAVTATGASTPHDRVGEARRRALVVGCGLGGDAEFVAGLGFATVAFDVVDTAIAMARARHPGSAVSYVVADVLDPPAEWRQAFDLVVECLTVQSLPPERHAAATARIAGFAAPGGTLIVVASAADRPPADGPPWPLTRAEIGAFARDGVRTRFIERTRAAWRAEFVRPARG